MDPDHYNERLARESQRWGVDYLDQLTWLHSETVRRHVNHMITGDGDKSWIDFVREKYLPAEHRGGRGLSLGCNHGILERQIVQAGICSSIDAFDISEAGIALAREEAEKAGVNVQFKVVDANTMDLSSASYSLVFVIMALHHFDRLEHVFTQIRDALETGGIFVFNEFVGPTRFQWTDLQLEIINRLRACLPASMLLSPQGIPVKPAARPDLEHFIRTEPYEAVRSTEILPLTNDYFEILGQHDYGGTVLHMLFHLILGNFDEGNEDHVALIRMLCEAERILLESEVLPSDFTLVVAKRRD